VLGEGAAVVVLEDLGHARARGARIYAEVIGYGTSGDAYHIAAPEPNGFGAQQAMRMALGDAGIDLEMVDYINAHGTSTPLGDASEAAAVKVVFGNHAFKLSVSSTKSMTGHTLGAAGGIESVAVIKCIEQQVAVPTINLEHPDAEHTDLDFVPNQPRERTIRCAINNSFGFGGHNVSLVFRRFDD
jgi:3-oxoacyl-[acyl-carrier-protein] synthase II